MAEFKLTVLGCGSAMPHKHHWPSSQVLQYGNNYFILDAGEGLQYHLHRHKISSGKVTGIFITHLHGDHIFGLVGYLLMMELAGRQKTLHIFAPTGVQDFIETQLHTFTAGFHYDIEYHTVTESGEIFRTKNLIIEAVKLRHRRMPCFGYIFKENSYTRVNILIDKFDEIGLNKKYINTFKTLFDEDETSAIEIKGVKYKTSDFCVRNTTIGKSFAYCTDNSFTHEYDKDTQTYNVDLKENSPIVQALKNVTLLYHEASYKQSEIEKAIKYYHSTAEEAATLAKYANVGELVIGHLSARYNDEREVLEEAQKIFPNTSLADEDKVFIISEK